jgi:hypothetical protein
VVDGIWYGQVVGHPRGSDTEPAFFLADPGDVVVSFTESQAIVIAGKRDRFFVLRPPTPGSCGSDKWRWSSVTFAASEIMCVCRYKDRLFGVAADGHAFRWYEVSCDLGGGTHTGGSPARFVPLHSLDAFGAQNTATAACLLAPRCTTGLSVDTVVMAESVWTTTIVWTATETSHMMRVRVTFFDPERQHPVLASGMEPNFSFPLSRMPTSEARRRIQIQIRLRVVDGYLWLLVAGGAWMWNRRKWQRLSLPVFSNHVLDQVEPDGGYTAIVM